jgi:hypothetical protein
MKLSLTALTVTAGALAACSDYPPPPPVAVAVPVAAVPAADIAPAQAPPMTDSCFFTRDIVGHQIADDHTLYIRVRSNAVYRLDMVGTCLATASSDDPLVIREPPGVPYVCRAVDLDISIAHNAGISGLAARTPCIVDHLTRLTPAEIAALPPRSRP